MLNPALDTSALAAAFRDRRRLVVQDVLDAETASRVHAGLGSSVPWRLAFRDNRLDGKAAQKSLTREAFRALGPGGGAAVSNTVMHQARDGFQYLYESFDIQGGRAAGEAPGHVLYELYDFLNGERFLDFARQLTGEDELDDVYAHATRYLPGHFLKEHEDVTDWDNRRYAYVLGLTPDWPSDGGGLLYFHGPGGVVEETFLPGYNTLSVFAVPIPHSVSMVAPWVRQPRLAVTGWLRVSLSDSA